MTPDNNTPKHERKDYLYTITKAGIGSIPVIGAAASELFSMLITSPLENRRMQWMQKVEKRLRLLENDQQISIEKLQKNQVFIDTVMQASQAAIRTHQKEKLDALVNAIENSAMDIAPDEIYQQIFLNYIETFTVLHFTVLNFLEGVAIGQKSGSEIIKDKFTQEGVENYIYEHVWNDLESKGLVTEESGISISFQVRRTPLGNMFIDFISSRYDK
jgi:hypothetical protein